MRASVLTLCILAAASAACRRAAPEARPSRAVPPIAGTFAIDGLSAPVRVTRDTWGVPHIVARTAGDLFVAQGFVQAEDRLFQMDLWRRSAQGRLAEVLGANFVGRDAMTRRVQYRGDLDAEWASYGPDTRAIAAAFVRGVNAWVAIAREHPPEAFVLAGWLPERWQPEDLLNRTDAFRASGDALGEVFRARLVAALGVDRAKAILGADAPAGVPPDLDPAAITFQVGDVLREVGTPPFFISLEKGVGSLFPPSPASGSNAWAIARGRSASGAPIVAMDPHRPLVNPSLRYLVHLTAPGWNVIGATAPWLPGVSAGHNDRVAWGMTAADADTEDLYVERLNPDNSHQIEAAGGWRNTTVVRESVWVKGSAVPVTFDREYTPHGVVIGVDREKGRAFALRWSGFEPGGAAELGALALDRAGSAAELRTALARWKMPAVEVVYADAADGAIASQVAALAPLRRGADGRLPAAGWTGPVDWIGWRTLDELPHATNPPVGFVASANRSRARTERLRTVLAPPRSFSIDDFKQLQHDVTAWNASRLVPVLSRLRAPRPDVDEARRRLLMWNRRVSADSTEAALYVGWELAAKRMLAARRLPAELVDEFLTRSSDTLIAALAEPSRAWFDGNATAARDRLVLDALSSAVDDLNRRGGAGAGRRPWGDWHATTFTYPLAIDDAGRRRFDVGPFARGGYADTVMSTAGQMFDATTGASFSAIVDTGDWDASVAQNAPGQSESPDSPHFADLARAWAAGDYFSLAFSDAAVAASAESTLTLVPRSAGAPRNPSK
jgi:penicillin G amidase